MFLTGWTYRTSLPGAKETTEEISPIFEATFEGGLLAIDNEKLVWLWIEEED
jgi:hypothetical protein